MTARSATLLTEEVVLELPADDESARAPRAETAGASGEPREGSSGDSNLKEVLRQANPVLEKYASPLLTVAGLVSLVAGLVGFLLSPNHFALSVWIEDSQSVYPSRLTDDLPLPLTYGETKAAAVRVAKLRVKNSGSEPIGTLDKLWSLTITDPGATRVVLLKAPDSEPSTTLLRPRAAGGSGNALRLDVGVLPPRAHSELTVALLYSGEERPTPLRVETSLPSLAVRDTAPKYELASKFLAPLALGIFLLVGVPEARRKGLALEADRERARRQLEKERERLARRFTERAARWRLVAYLALNAFGSFLLATLLAIGIGWALAFFV